MNKRIMVDMSATLIHHGHVRLLKKASKYGKVIVGLTNDEEIKKKKFFDPELAFEHRKEVLESIKYVSEVVSTPWMLDEAILDKYDIDLLVHGDDNSNQINGARLKLLPRTKDISSTELRQKALKSITSINNQKLMLTPGPAVVLHENLSSLKPFFGRGDNEYTQIFETVSNWVKQLCGQDELIVAQGSSTFALELAAHSFVEGKILLISTGYYSDRLERLLPKGSNITICHHKDLDNINEKFDWVMCAYTETSIAFKLDLTEVKALTNNCNAKLYVDATGSIGLEDKHELADVMAFSSCKGLFGLPGACFVAYKKYLIPKSSDFFYFNLETHRNKMVTGAYHAIASLHGVIDIHDCLKKRVVNSKNLVLKKWSELVRKDNQPLLCTYVEGEVLPNDDNIVLYTPRSELKGSVICHFGEIHYDEVNLVDRISVTSST
jgi:2-aminoethylphosphonate-pyruvate transaminase